MRWVTRERPKIDRLVCPWLIRRFIDRDAEIHYVPAAEVLAVAESEGAIPFDVPGVELTHSGRLCSFDAKLALALGSWLAFEPAGDGAMVMGDLVLTATEVSPVMARLIEGGVEITALHKVAKTEAITEGDDLADAKKQVAACANSTKALQSAVDYAERASKGYRAVSVTPKLSNGHAVAVVTLLKGTSAKTVSEPLE